MKYSYIYMNVPFVHAKAFLDYGADPICVYKKDKDERTLLLLHIALDHHHLEMVNLLGEYGTDFKNDICVWHKSSLVKILPIIYM